MRETRVKSTHMGRYQLAVIGVSMLMAGMILGGCGGDAGSCGFGGARGYVYQTINGCSIMISASPTAPSGYQPVPAGTVVRIEGFPEITTVTDARGFYYLPAIPAGLQVLVIEAPCGTETSQIPIIPGRITDGGGHSEGGSG
jgi:hypothetical protein